MKYKLLGASGLRVSELCLGTMTFGETWGWGADEATCGGILDAFAERGGNFVDTANNYTDGTSEEIVGRLIADRRDDFVIATKYTLAMANGNRSDPNLGGNSRKSMIRSVEASLRRLNTDYIDLLYLHMWDFTTPVEEVMRGVHDLVSSGKVHYFAFSDTPTWIVTYAIGLAERHGWPRPIAVQLPYSLLGRDPETDYFPMAESFDLSLLTWGMLSGGTLTGKYNKESDEPRRSSSASDRELEAAAKVVSLAADLGCTPSQLAIAWVRQQSSRAIPILGARTVAQAQDNLGVLDVSIPDDIMGQIDAITGFTPGFPRRFLTRPMVRDLVFGSTFAQLENHRDPIGE